jgi:hypothetical protein
LKTNAQSRRSWEDIDTSGFHTRNIVRKHGFTLIFINKDSLFNPITELHLKEAFWQIYPAEVKRFNKKAMHTITIVVSNDYRGVAATLNGVVKIDQNWLRKNPEDIDLITHELMHAVQGYNYNVPDNWLTDGIADYARYTFGINNLKSGWALPPFVATQSYKNSYRVAARFLVWVEKNKNSKIVDKLDKSLRDGTYQPYLWSKLTGKTLDELWMDYGTNPMIKA